MQPIHKINTQQAPREILIADFKSLNGGLPIHGGWGYTQNDACIIDRNDPLVDAALPFDGIGIEYLFVEKRIYEEMIILRPDGDAFSGIQWSLQSQCTLASEGRRFDKLVFEITAFGDGDWEALKAEFAGPRGYGHPDFDGEAHERKRQEKTVRFTREFWFDITSFMGKG